MLRWTGGFAAIPAWARSTQPGQGVCAAWFKIDTGTQKVVSQGYVSSKGANLLHPGVAAPALGPAGMMFSITGPTIGAGAVATEYIPPAPDQSIIGNWAGEDRYAIGTTHDNDVSI